MMAMTLFVLLTIMTSIKPIVNYQTELDSYRDEALTRMTSNVSYNGHFVYTNVVFNSQPLVYTSAECVIILTIFVGAMLVLGIFFRCLKLL